MDDRSKWPDERLDDFKETIDRRFTEHDRRFAALASINEIRRLESAMNDKIGGIDEKLDKLSDSFDKSQQGMSRPEKIALFSAGVAFFGVLVGALTTIFGVG